MQQRDPSLTADQLVTERARPLFEEARSTCAGKLLQDVLQAGLNRENALQPEYVTAFKAVLPTMEYTTMHLLQPLFVGTGEQDHDVPPASQLALVRDACAAGSVVDAHLYAGLNHSKTVHASLKDSVPFVRKLLAGEPITPMCEPAAE